MALDPIKWEMRVYGIDELNASMRRLPKVTRRKFQRRGMRTAAKIFEREAKAQAPRLSGRMADTLKIRPLKRSRTRFGYMVRTGTRAELGIPEKAKGYYPAAVEYGYKQKNGRSALPNPFMRRAFDSKQTEMRSAMTDSIWADVREAVAEVRAR